MPSAKKDISEGREDILGHDLDEAREHFTSVTKADPDNVDGWNGLGAVHFEQGELALSLEAYRKALVAAERAYGGRLPYKMGWKGKHKPALRALHGIGLNLFRMGDYTKAIEAFENLLDRNPADNQGVKFLLADAKKKRNLWSGKKV